MGKKDRTITFKTNGTWKLASLLGLVVGFLSTGWFTSLVLTIILGVCVSPKIREKNSNNFIDSHKRMYKKKSKAFEKEPIYRRTSCK